MPTTRHGSETPKRATVSQGRQRSDQKATTQNNKGEVKGSKIPGTPKTSQGVEAVRSTRRSQAVLETNPATPRRTRGSNLEPTQEKEVTVGKRTTKEDVVKSADTGGPAQSTATRNTKRPTETPKTIPTKRQKVSAATSATTATRDAEPTSDKEKSAEPEQSQEEEIGKEKKTGKGDVDNPGERAVDNGKDVQNSLDDKSKNSKAKTVQVLKSATQAAVAAGLVSGVAVMSPRRSSRAVVPNSRFKDMVDPGKKKYVLKTGAEKEVSAPAPKRQRVDYTSINVQQQGEPKEITEEIITEETKIDPLAQMNLMDDMLVLPPTSERITVTSSAITDTETDHSVTTGIRVIKYPSAKVIKYQLDSKGVTSIGSDDLTEETEDQTFGVNSSYNQTGNNEEDVSEISKTQNDFLQGDSIPEPQVIVIPGETGVSKIIIPKDPYRARLEQAFEKKGGSLVIGPSTGKTKSKKLIVTPTHQHASKKEAQKEHGEKIQLKDTVVGRNLGKDTVVGKNLGKSSVTSVIYPWTQKPGISTGQIIHTPEKRQRFTVIPRKEVSTVTEVIPHTVDESTEVTVSNIGISDSNTPTLSANAVNAVKVPNVRVVYVKAKQKPSSTVTADVGKKSEHENDDQSSSASALNETLKTLQKFPEVQETSIGNSEQISREIVNMEELDIAQERGEKGDTDAIEGTKTLDEDVANVPDATVEIIEANSLCQVIEYKQPQTAIEYVLLDNKMVPIHKPFQSGHHGRVNTGRRAEVVHRVTPGRVEPGGLKEQGVVKKIPLSAAQSAISTVLSQIEDGQIHSVHSVSRNNHTEYTATSRQQEMVDENINEALKTDVQTGRVVHGYIDNCAQSSSPTQIVEISTEAFNKEIYGEEVTLDTVTGEIMQGSVGTSQAELISMPSVVSVPESVAGNHAEKETEHNQSRQGETDVQSITKTVQSSDNESPVIYTESEASHEEGVMIWKPGEPVVSSEGSLLLSNVQGTTGDGLMHIDGLDSSKIPENATVTVQKLASGGEIVIMQIKETAVSETLQKIKTSQINSYENTTVSSAKRMPSIVKATVVSKPSTDQSKRFPTNVRIAPVKKLPEVKITPVRAYEKSETQSCDKGESSSVVVSKTTGTSTEDIEEENVEMEEDEEEEEEEEGIQVEDSALNTDNPYQEYIVVRLPEGTEIKQMHARPKKDRLPAGENITMDGDGMYVCVDCDHRTENRGNWFKHRRKHLGIRPHACQICSYRAATSSNLKRHMQIHDDVRNFLCVYCNMLFRQKIHLERHLKYKHEEKNVQCPLCDYVCSSENPDLKNHIKRRHMPQEGALNAFTCDVCGLMTVSKKDLKQHKKFHKNGPELKLFCEHCSFVTDCVSRLRRHMLIHTKERPFQCGLCSYRATQKEHVLRHMRSQHGVEVERNHRRSLLEKNYRNPQEILVAGMEQTSSSSSREASAEVDMGPFEKSDYSSTDKIFACNYCSMKFAKLINLYKHLYAQHKQVMPDEGTSDFPCVVCDFRTNSKKNLLVHMRKHNMQDHTPPTHVYSCVLCRYINPRRRNLFQHMKKKHGIEIIMKDDGLNCYVTLDNAAAQVQGHNVKSSVMALSDIVTTQTMDDAAQMEFITEAGDESAVFQAEKISIDNIIADEMESYVVSDSSQETSMVSPQVSISSVLHASVQEHEAAEAIEGLQALAEQAGILETQNIDNDMTTEIVSSAIEVVSTNDINDDAASNNTDAMVKVEVPVGEQSSETAEGLELSSEQLNQLATGDYVEINGEVYKVEIAPDAS